MLIDCFAFNGCTTVQGISKRSPQACLIVRGRSGHFISEPARHSLSVHLDGVVVDTSHVDQRSSGTGQLKSVLPAQNNQALIVRWQLALFDQAIARAHIRRACLYSRFGRPERVFSHKLSTWSETESFVRQKRR